MRPINLFLVLGTLLPAAVTATSPHAFDGSIPRRVLDNYLARSVTFSELLHGRGNVGDNLRFLKNTGAKFVGRAIYRWGGEAELPRLLETARPIVRRAHESDPELILQAAAFEIVSDQVQTIEIPARVFQAFGLPPEDRRFNYEAMLYPEGSKWRDHWRKGASVPDMSQLETRLWFFYLATVYIDIGVEAIHFGQVEIMDDRDPGRAYWREMLTRVRAYARKHARRHLVLCDAHVPSGGIVHEGRLMFDFHSFPLRIKEVPGKPQAGVLEIGHLDSIYGRSKGGLAPSGWRCESLPYLVELDNYGASANPGKAGNPWFPWGYDEICWFAHQPEAYRNKWLGYAWEWIREHDPNGWLQMPGSRTLASPVDGKRWYWANQASPECPDGFNQEEAIKEIWGSGSDL